MTIKELKEIINQIPDDFNTVLHLTRTLTPKELSGLYYPYPTDKIITEIKFGDIGWSDKIVFLDVDITEYFHKIIKQLEEEKK